MFGDPKTFTKKAAAVVTATFLLCYGVAMVSQSMGVSLNLQVGGTEDGNLRSMSATEQAVATRCDETAACFVSIDPRPNVEKVPGWSVLPAQSIQHHRDGVHQMVKGEMWILGGRHGDETMPSCSIFNFETQTYRFCNKPNRAFQMTGEGYHDDYIYILGGATQGDSPVRFSYRYKTTAETDYVQAIPLKPTLTVGHSCHEHKAKMYCAFGESSTKPLTYENKMEVLDLEEMEWSTDMPSYEGDPIGRFNQASVKVTVKGVNYIYYFGGLTHPASGSGRFTRSTVSKFNLDELKWEKDDMPMPGGTYRAGAVVYGDRILLVGGFVYKPTGGAQEAVSTLWEYDPVTQDWWCHDNLPYRVGGGGVHVKGDKLYVLGGGQGGYRTTGLGLVYGLKKAKKTQCPPEIPMTELLNAELEFRPKMPSDEELVPGGFAFGANPRVRRRR